MNIRCTDITTNVFYLRKFKAVIFKNVTIHTGKYGLYVRDTYSVQVYNCAFWRLGSSTSAAIHNFSNTQAEQRPTGLQDIAQTVLNIPSFIYQLNETLESAIYVASNNYQFNNDTFL